MIINKVILVGLFGLSAINSVPSQPYLMPLAWPSSDQTYALNGNFLNDPIVVNALNHVNSIVSPKLLAIPPSQFISGATVTYVSDPVANCYWPNKLCVRSMDTEDWKADIYSCLSSDTWGLSYDDGPTVNLVNGIHTDDTGAIRNALADASLKATFFVVGSNAIKNPNEVKLTYQAGHQIALHTWTHHPLTSLTNQQIVAELKFNEAIIYKAIGVVPAYFRPPYGDIDDRVRAIVHALGYRVVIWGTSPSRDSGDADSAPSQAQVVSIENQVKSWFGPQPGFISLEHDISTFTSSVAVSIIRDIQAQGASFPLKVMPVGTCRNDAEWYSNRSGTPPLSNSASNQGYSVDRFQAVIICSVVFLGSL
jgi:peptidoglycan/xylan/chitin deacetylase (PgdA/CDA1 family)